MVFKWRVMKQNHSQRRVRRFREICIRLSQYNGDLFFVKIGANDGVTGDPCADILLADKKWHGLLVEPVPYVFERLAANYSEVERFTLVQGAIGASAGRQVFYYVDRNADRAELAFPFSYDQIGSFKREHIAKHLDGVLIPYITEHAVRVETLSDLLERHNVRKVDLLHIDVEGQDYDVLKSLDFSIWQPTMIFVEHKHVSRKQKRYMFKLLRNHQYLVCDCGSDCLAVHKDHENLWR